MLAILLRVVILVTSDGDAELATRIEGQTADLDAEVVRVTRAPLPPALGAQLATARRLADDRDADAVVWFGRDGGGWIVHVAEPDRERVLVRRVQTRDGAMSDSAAIEAAAVVVRTAIRGLAAGGEIGVSEGTSEPPPPAPAPAPPPEVVIEPPSGTDGVGPLRPFAELAAVSVLDGERGSVGARARLGAAGGPYRIAAVVAHHPGAAYRSRDATIEVERQALGVALGIDVLGGARGRGTARWRVAGDVALVMTRFPRTTTATSAGLMPTAASITWTPVATPAVRVARRVAPATWIAVTIGADLVARPPAFGVTGSDGTFTPVAELWPVEPHVSVGVVVDPF